MSERLTVESLRPQLANAVCLCGHSAEWHSGLAGCNAEDWDQPPCDCRNDWLDAVTGVLLSILAARGAVADDGLAAKVEALAIARQQLAYASCPTMGYVGPKTPVEFAHEDAADHLVRLALVTCIQGANAALAKIDALLGAPGDGEGAEHG